MKRVLSIDGGGIKGVFPAALLAAVEESVGQPTADHFDLIAGTSTGGILALGLALKIPARKILQLYREQGPIIFGSPARQNIVVRKLHQLFTARHEPEPLRSALEDVFKEARLGDSAVRLTIPAYHPTLANVHVFKTAHHPRLEVDYRERMVDVAMATAAAPTYFPVHQMPSGLELVDGGIWAGNPVAVAALEATTMLEWPKEDVRVLSLGCTDSMFTFPRSAGQRHARRIIELILQSQERAAIGMASLLLGHPHEGERIVRVSPAVTHGRYALDDTTKIDELAGLGDATARQQLPRLRSLFFDGPAEPFKSLR